MKMNTIKSAVTGALATTALLATSAQAEVYFSGFASIVTGKTLSSDESLYGYNDNMDFKQDSLIALQASSDLEQGLGVTVQLAAKGKDDWQPSFNWAYVSYDASDNLRLLAGRQRAPFYMYSDYLDVSYAYPWITPPNGVYDLIFDTFDGLGAVYNTSIGDSDLSLHGIYGRNTDAITAFGQQARLEVNDIAGLATTLTYDWLTLRAAYFTAEASLPFADLDTLASGWAKTPYANISPATQIEQDDTSFLEVGFQISYDKIIVVGEYTELTLENTPLAEESSYYLMAGYQLNGSLVHLTYGVDDNVADDYTASVPSGLSVALDTLKAQTSGFINSQNREESYISLGSRFDFHDAAALKVEYTKFTNDNDSSKDASALRVALVTVF